MDKLQQRVYEIIKEWYEQAIELAIIELVEKKHLYQSVTINFPTTNNIIADTAKRMSIKRAQFPKFYDTSIKQIHALIPEMEWKFDRTLESKKKGVTTQPQGSEEIYFPITISIKGVKIFCANCNRIEAYNIIDGIDIYENSHYETREDHFAEDQVLVLSFQCQSCKDIPEIFIIRRVGLKITLCGRVPMEVIELPKYLPKDFSKFISDAILAFNSGQILPGKFMLRTFIEQYIRNCCLNPTSTNIEELFNEYSSRLPKEMREKFPSLKAIYDLLSVDLHSANIDETLFNDALTNIYKHFDAKRLFTT